MPIPASGALSFGTFDYYFGNGNHGDFFSGPNSNVPISSYYRGGTYVPNITTNNSIPISGQISFDNFRGATGKIGQDFPTSVGISGTLKGTKSWGSPQFGGGGGIIESYRADFVEQHLYRNSATNILTYELGSGSNDAVLINDDLTFVSFTISSAGGPTNEYTRSSGTYTAATSTTPNKWTWSVGTDVINPSLDGTFNSRLKFFS